MSSDEDNDTKYVCHANVVFKTGQTHMALHVVVSLSRVTFEPVLKPERRPEVHRQAESKGQSD